jgi:hypothetical protein
MSNVDVSIELSPKKTGALYMKSIDQAERITELELKVSRLEARGIADMQNRIDELEAAIAQHKRETQEMKDYTRFPAYSFENTKLWQVIE